MTSSEQLLALAERERDEARSIVRDIHWMARRYCDGRQSYAVGMFNDAVRKAFEAGWLEHRLADEPQYARDGMFSPEWQSIEARLQSVIAENERFREGLSRIADAPTAFDGGSIAECRRIAAASLRALSKERAE